MSTAANMSGGCVSQTAMTTIPTSVHATVTNGCVRRHRNETRDRGHHRDVQPQRAPELGVRRQVDHLDRDQAAHERPVERSQAALAEPADAAQHQPRSSSGNGP